MTISFFRRLFGMGGYDAEVTPEPEETQEEDESLYDGYGRLRSYRLTEQQRGELIKQSIQKSVTDFPVEVIAADDNAGLTSLKGAFTGIYQGMGDVQASWYTAQGFIGYQMCAIIAQHWLVNKACTVPAQDAFRNGYQITFNGGVEAGEDVLDFIRKKDRRYKMRWHLEQLVRMGKIFGVRHALFKVRYSDPDAYEKPFNIDAVTPGSYEGISQIDPYWITPELDAAAAADPASLHFYEPTYWRVNGRRYHRSHFVIMINSEVADILKPSYIYGGQPLTQMIYERVYSAERCAGEAPGLLSTKRSTVIHVDMEKAIAKPAEFQAKMEEWAYFRDNYGIKAVGMKEQIEQFDTALADVDAVTMTQYQLVAALAEVPATKLLSTSPKGFNATGEYDESAYHESLESLQEHFGSPLLERHHAILMRSAVIPKFPDLAGQEIEAVWNPTDAPTAKEIAELQKYKAETGKILIDGGAIDGMDERARVAADPESGYSGISTLSEEPSDVDEEETILGQ